MVRLRLKRMGRRHRPFYRLNAVEKRTQRDGRVLEPLGWYDPLAKSEDKQIELNAERIKFWLEHGAQPSETVGDLLARHGIIDAEKNAAARESRLVGRKKKLAVERSAKEAAEKAEAEAKAKAEAEAAAKAAAEAAEKPEAAPEGDSGES